MTNVAMGHRGDDANEILAVTDGVVDAVRDAGRYASAAFARARVMPWLGIPFWDSVSWDYRNSEFRFRFRSSGTFRRKSKSENLKTVQVENRNSGTDFSGIPEFR